MPVSINNLPSACEARFEEPLARHTSIKLGGPAAQMLLPKNEEDLLACLKTAHQQNVPFRMLGRGSNVLFHDRPFEGVIIKTTHLDTVSVEGNAVRAAAGASLQHLVNTCLEHNLGGLEYLYSIPGTVGGALYMNAGRGKQWNLFIGNHVSWVRVFDGTQIHTLHREACRFAYRTSIFHEQPHWTILDCGLELTPQPEAVGRQRVQERLAFTRKAQDNRYPNVGSLFKDQLRPMPEWRGKTLGGAQISPRSENWILNRNNAQANDAIQLIHNLMDAHAQTYQHPPVLEIEIF
jgi:UDP-N-acetylmuramate dehydrogenase